MSYKPMCVRCKENLIVSGAWKEKYTAKTEADLEEEAPSEETKSDEEESESESEHAQDNISATDNSSRDKREKKEAKGEADVTAMTEAEVHDNTCTTSCQWRQRQSSAH